MGVKDASLYELYFTFAAVWACGSALSVVGGTDYRKEFSKWWKETFKTVKFPHRGEVCFYPYPNPNPNPNPNPDPNPNPNPNPNSNPNPNPSPSPIQAESEERARLADRIVVMQYGAIAEVSLGLGLGLD